MVQVKKIKDRLTHLKVHMPSTGHNRSKLSPVSTVEYQAAVETRNSEDKDATTSLKRSSEATTDYSTSNK